MLEPVVAEMRADFGLPGFEESPLTEEEVELVWGINARIFYLGQRIWIFNMPLTIDSSKIIEDTIISFLAGARQLLPELVVQPASL